MELLDLIRPWLLALAFTLPRLLVMFAIMPLFVESIIPATIRSGIIIAFAAFLLPLTHDQVLLINNNSVLMAAILIKEGVLGLFMGFIFSIPFWAVRATGFLIDTQRGTMSALFFSPLSSNMVSPTGILLSQLTITLLFVSGSFLLLIQAIYVSYQTWPINHFIPPLNIDTIRYFLSQLDKLMYTTLLLAGPFLGLMVIIDLGAGLIGRYLPQLNLFQMTMPLKSGLAFFFLMYYVIIIANYLRDNFITLAAQLQILEGILK
ncbi:type III secretion system export apparatus subunit SctT [Thiofilum flexile]|uniref:type III secretion system export apparatus subunit SctT n=1 Tax=Thiofilum flexile TaxID=125627 RepID=UPI00037E425C|nr:type III secretion system export apparatus subunit SctT [Thiofilum flexile]